MENNIKLPKLVVLELTYKCNHKCLFCSCPWYAPSSVYPVKEELDLAQWKRAIDRLYDAGVEKFSITGGEAILKKETPDIVRYIRDEGHRRGFDHQMVLISNGKAMSDEWLHFFKEHIFSGV